MRRGPPIQMWPLIVGGQSGGFHTYAGAGGTA
jgi:hypothetical protein